MAYEVLMAWQDVVQLAVVGIRRGNYDVMRLDELIGLLCGDVE